MISANPRSSFILNRWTGLQRREVEARTLIEKRRFHGRVLATFGGSQFLPRDDTATRACAATMIINFTPVPIIQ